MGETGDFYIHNFPIHSARADRIEALLAQKQQHSVDDFCQMQLDLLDKSANHAARFVAILRTSDDEAVQLAVRLLDDWDCQASIDSSAACVYYPFLDRYWPRRFMAAALQDDLINLLPAAAPGLNRWISEHLSARRLGPPSGMAQIICTEMAAVVKALQSSLGEDGRWRWGDLHQVAFAHRLHKEATWADMSWVLMK